MKLALYIAAAACVTAQAFADEWREFKVTTDYDFSVQTTGTGRVRITDKCICFEINSLQLETFSNQTPVIELIGLNIGLAYKTPGEDWSVLTYTPLIELPVMLRPDSGRLELSTMKRNAVIPDDFSQRDYWVLVQVVMRDDNPAGYATTYAHEPGYPP